MASSKNKVDIVFVVDNSGSMAPVIEGVKNHINVFVNSLENNANQTIDYRLGFVFQGTKRILVKDFTSNVNDFQRAITKTVQPNNFQDELGLFGIDLAADFPWEERRHKFIIIFTDEDVSGGHMAEYQLSKYPELLLKLEALRIKIYYLGVDGEDYRELKKVPGTYYEPNTSFESVDFSELLKRIGKSVSQASGQNLQESHQSFKKDLYKIEQYIRIEIL
jgi:uncharacterized protein YegL